MSEQKHFVWLLDNGEARKGGRLFKGQQHSIEPFGESVVAEWVKTGAAEYVGGQKVKKVKE